MKTRTTWKHAVSVGIGMMVGTWMSAFAVTNAHAQVYPAGMVSYWTFDDGTATDVLGNNHGVIVGAPVAVAGKVGGALRFDGIDDGIVVQNSPSLSSAQLTMEVWVSYLSYKTAWFSRRNMIFDKRIGGVGTFDLAYNGYRDPGNTGGWEPYLYINGVWHWFIQGLTTQIPTNTWYHVVTTYDGNYVRMYENGALLKSWLQPGALTATTAPLHIAKPGHPLDSYSNAIIDEAAIYNRALTLAEVQAHYLNGLNGVGYVEDVTVTIDIKPGPGTNAIKLTGKGSVPVAIVSSDTFDATTVDVSTVVFAGASPLPIGMTAKDVNADGRLDVILHFNNADLNLAPESTQACLTGMTLGGQKFKACDTVRIID